MRHDNQYDGSVTIENERYRLIVEPDTWPQDPRKEYDNVGTMVCGHHNYILGDVQAENTHRYTSWEEWFVNEILVPELDFELEDDDAMYDHNEEDDADYINPERVAAERERRIKEAEESIVYLPLFLYDHSGITMYTSGTRALYYQHEDWDSMQVGYIYVWEDKARYEWGDEWRERAENYLNGEVQEYDAYLRGDIICFTLEGIADDNDDIHEGCCGIYPDERGDFTDGIRAYIPEDAYELLDEL